ncbi:hypothetical protein Hanom_Chr16g01466551 [Helianthus anomalus]
MASYWEGLKSSIVIYLLHARLKMAYEAKALGFECPSWNVDAWEMKLRGLASNPVEHPTKSAVEGSSKATEKLTEAGGEAGKDVRADPKLDTCEDVIDEEGVAP